VKNFIDVYVIYYKDIILNKFFVIREKMHIDIEEIIYTRTGVGNEFHSVIFTKSGKYYHTKETVEELNKIVIAKSKG
jgi:hypothetical protein